MTGKPPPIAADAKARAAREARLAEALRANLARRKAQARGRAGAGEAKGDTDKDTKEQDS